MLVKQNYNSPADTSIDFTRLYALELKGVCETTHENILSHNNFTEPEFEAESERHNICHAACFAQGDALV